MNLQDYVRSLTFAVDVDTSALAPSRTVEAVHALARNESFLEQPKTSRVDYLESLLNAAAETRAFEFTRRDWRDIPWVMWRTPRDAPMSDSEMFLDRLGDYILRKDSRPRLLSLIRSYITEFDETRLGTRRVGPLLRLALADGAGSFAERWRDLDTELELFDPAHAVKALARRVLNERRLDGTLVRIGVDAGRMQDSLIRRAFEESVVLAAPSIRFAGAGNTPEPVDFVFEWNSIAKGGLRYAGTPIMVASIFLEAAAAALNHNPVVERNILRRLIHWLGDPRFEPQHWHGVSDVALRYARRLLITETLDAFFAILDKYAEPDAWRRRREFWEQYHQSGYVTESWIAFGPAEALREAKQKQISHAKLEDASSPKRSIIFLAFDDLIVAEASENGLCRFFKRSGMKDGFYSKQFDYGSLHRLYRDSLVHVTHGWEKKIAGKIFSATGIRHPQYGKGDA